LDPSRSSEVDDFRVIWKGLRDFLLVINSNLSSISHRFWDTTTYRLKIANFPYPTSVRSQIWKCSLCTRSLKFCMMRANTLGELTCNKIPPSSTYVISAHQRYRQTDGRTDVIRRQYRSIAIAWSGKKWIQEAQLQFKELQPHAHHNATHWNFAFWVQLRSHVGFLANLHGKLATDASWSTRMAPTVDWSVLSKELPQLSA